MKKLYRKGTVHPSPPPPVADHLCFLPATILTLAVALTPEDREVLAYLISCSGSSPGRRNTAKTGGGGAKGGEHPPMFNCDCFRCYMSYWVRWDSSPNRQLIHEIIDAFEDGLVQSKKGKSRKERRKRGSIESDEVRRFELSGESHSVGETTESGGGGDDDAEIVDVCGDGGEEGTEKGSMRKIMSFIGERIWNVWGQ